MIKLKQILTLLLVAISTCIYAQLPVPTLTGSAKYSAKDIYTSEHQKRIIDQKYSLKKIKN